ncbi:MAG: CHAT domain-containing tetratricopeptide repeat protein [Actinomycetota bacterium]|nr:CHAT domain-containing tetratricopeptide repeat protein [Actinomycetota bacterium]
MTTNRMKKARAALAAAREDPKPTIESATRILEQAADDEERATAHFAIGLAHRALGAGADSTTHLELAAQHATNYADLHGQVLRSLAFNYGQAGRHGLADTTVEESIALLSGQERDLSRLQQAFILMMRGDHQGALPVLTEAIRSFEASGDDDYRQLTLYNRALIHMEFGDYDTSIADLGEAYEIAIRLDNRVSAADAALHLSQVLGWQDDVPGAMEWHSRSVALRTAAGAPNPVADTEHAFILIQAHLMREAEEVLHRSIPRLLEAGDNQAIAVPAHLLLADVLTERGAFEEAITQIELAREITPADGRYRFDVAAADHKTRIAAGETTSALLASIVITAEDMDANGERHAAAVERFRAVDVALPLGDITTAMTMCDDAARIVRDGPLWLQIQAWTALAQVRLALGNRRGAAAAVRAGFNRLDEYRSGIGATDLRIHASQFGARLAEIGVSLAIESRSVARVFHWSERLRTAPLSVAADTGPDPALRDALTQLRQASSRLRSTGAEERGRLRDEQLRQERRVRDLARQATGTSTSRGAVTLADVQESLDGRVLIEFIDVGNRITAVIVTAHSAGLMDLGPSPDTEALIDHLRFAAERIARPSSSEASRLAALASADETADLIREKLITPNIKLIGSQRPVVIPTGTLHGVPWALVLGGPVEVAPSATIWLEARRTAAGTGHNLVVHGPDLVHATAEADAIANIVNAEVASTAATAVAGLPRANLAHFACHARPRLDSPMFSSLLLNDGELTLYDIEQLNRAPATVVLAACDGGSTVLATGDEVMGMASAFLALGTRTVVAPLFTVSDEATATVMRRFHEAHAAGQDAAEALDTAASSDDPIAAFTARSFACFGAA